MSIYTLYPVVDIEELEKAVNLQFDVELDLRELLFDDTYDNDSLKRFWYDNIEEFRGYSWQDEKSIREIALVKTYLQDTIPDYGCVLIDVSW